MSYDPVFDRAPHPADGLIAQLRAEIERLQQEIDVLRQYGNKDCTAMADEELDRLRAHEQEARDG